MKPAPEYQELYVESYEQNNVDRTLSGRFLQKSHKLLEDALPSDMRADRVLEVGAGSGHHYRYLREKPREYVLTDGSDPMLRVSRQRYADEVATGRIIIEKQDASALTYDDASFDRLIATHVLEHIPDPVGVLREWSRVVRSGGLLSIVLPCDPGLLWRLGRHFGPRRNAQRLGLPYDYVQAADHVNSIFNLVVFIRHHFDLTVEQWYPARVPVPDLNLFYVCHLRNTP
ncbi:MAG TPA: class I SAM-dependent methyltransferase [Lysobacter sp.]|nr:class I SAM-dependent methyltransferase [Lysobacter sp.]